MTAPSAVTLTQWHNHHRAAGQQRWWTTLTSSLVIRRESRGEPEKTRAGSSFSALKQIVSLFALQQWHCIWQDALCLCSVGVGIWCYVLDMRFSGLGIQNTQISCGPVPLASFKGFGLFWKLKLKELVRILVSIVHSFYGLQLLYVWTLCSIGDSVHVIPLKRMKTMINLISNLLSRDAITCSSYTESACRGL